MLHIFVILFVSGSVEGSMIITSPADTTGVIGSSTKFECEVMFESIKSMAWYFDNDIIYYYFGGVEEYPFGASKFLVTKTENSFTLFIKDLEYADGGIYTCSTTIYAENATLLVLGIPSIASHPLHPVETDLVIYTCEAQFGGPSIEHISLEHYPYFRMILVGGETELQCEAETEDKANFHNLIKYCNVTVEARNHGQKLVCEIGTFNPIIKSTNITTMNVLYSVQNITYSPQHKKYKVGSVLTCTADGNPSPTFEWEDEYGLRSPITGTLLNITENMVGPNSWRCTAKTSIRDNLFELSVMATFEAEHYSGSQAIQGYIIVIIAIVVLGTISLLFIIAFWCIRERHAETWYDNVPLQEMPMDSLSPKLLELMKIIGGIQTTADWDSHGRRIEDILQKHGVDFLQSDPQVFSGLVEKASIPLESATQIRVIEKISQVYCTYCKKTGGPLGCLLKLMNDENSGKYLFADQEQLHSIIQELIPADSLNPRTKFLKALMTRSEYISHSTYTVEWTERLLSTLKLLLENRANPTWIADGWETSERRTRYTAQYDFFWVVKRVLLNKNNLFRSLLEIIPLFMAVKKSNTVNARGTPLHALTDIDWDWFREQIDDLPPQFFRQYKEIITQVIGLDPKIADMTDWYGRTALHIYLDKICLDEKIVKDVITIAKVLKSDKNISTGDQNGYTVLHYFAESFPVYHKELPHGQQQALLNFVEYLTSPQNIDAHDNKGNTPLHILAEKYPWDHPGNSLNIFLEVIKYLASRTKDHVQNQHGFTVLHTVVNKVDQNIIYHCNEPFSTLVHLCCADNNVKDKDGLTVLHVLARKVFFDPNLCDLLVPIFNILATSENVNAQDKHSVTPYSWILSGEEAYEELTTKYSFSKVQKIFLERGANDDIARQGIPYIQSSDIMVTCNKIQRKEDLDIHGGNILDMLKVNGHTFLSNRPNVLLKLVQKVDKLIQSEIYIEIIQQMAEIQHSLSNKSTQGYLQGLCQPMLTENGYQILCQHQRRLHFITQVLAPLDSSDSVNTFLKNLLRYTEYLSESECPFKWTRELISTLEILFKIGGNSACLPNKIFSVIRDIIFFNNDLCQPLIDILPSFLSQKNPNYKYDSRSPLHDLAKLDWNFFNEKLQEMPPGFFKQYKEIISVVIKHDPDLLNQKDFYGRTPLHLFIDNIKLQENILVDVTDIVRLLKSETNVDSEDKKHKTVLHYLAGAFPVLQEPATIMAKKVFLDLAFILKSDINIDLKDIHGNTPLHIHAEKISKVTLKDRELFNDLLVVLKSPQNAKYQDNDGCTVLHVFGKIMYQDPGSRLDIIGALQMLATPENVNIQDNAHMTPYSWILGGQSLYEELDKREVFKEIVNIFLAQGADHDLAEKGITIYIKTIQQSQTTRPKEEEAF